MIESIEAFFAEETTDEQHAVWGTKKEKEIRRRIMLSVAAYAYEIKSETIMSDAEFDKQCSLIDINEKTGNRKLDSFFKKHFDPSTGQWIHKHPELRKIQWIYETFYIKK